MVYWEGTGAELDALMTRAMQEGRPLTVEDMLRAGSRHRRTRSCEKRIIAPPWRGNRHGKS
jgi:hypothetical protein